MNMSNKGFIIPLVVGGVVVVGAIIALLTGTGHVQQVKTCLVPSAAAEAAVAADLGGNNFSGQSLENVAAGYGEAVAVCVAEAAIADVEKSLSGKLVLDGGVSMTVPHPERMRAHLRVWKGLHDAGVMLPDGGLFWQRK